MRGITFLFMLPGVAARISPHSSRFSLHGRVQMAKEELLTVAGQIEEILPDGRFSVLLDNGHRMIAYTAGKMRKYRIRSIVGDRVHVEMTPYDLTKGRIVFRELTPKQGPAKRQRGGFRR
jgi:translation initiation factor IF-1